MNHQKELEKKKYRNWVRGGLAYKYLRQGIEDFADDVVQKEHSRILTAVGHTPGLVCSRCCLRDLRPLHKCVTDHATGNNKCYWGQSNCNCLYTKKESCHLKVCDGIMEEIFKSHGSSPPTPKWINTDIQKWCTDPWEIAKCFINAQGYSDKNNASEIDTAGLLHIFINNINLQSHLSGRTNNNDIFKKALQRRNDLFHSPTMEMEDIELNECIDYIIAILQDEKELKSRLVAQEAVIKLMRLKQENLIISTHNEAEICREALVSITKTTEELKQTIKDAKETIGNTIQGAKVDINEKRRETTDAIQHAEDDMNKKRKETIDAIKVAKEDMDKKRKEATEAIQVANDDFHKKQSEVLESIDVESQKIVQGALQEIDSYRESLHERVGRLETDSSVSKQRLSLLEGKVAELDTIFKSRKRHLDYIERKRELTKSLVELYQTHYVNTSISPLKIQENDINVQEMYVAQQMVVEDAKPGLSQTKSEEKSHSKGKLIGYREILQTSDKKHKNIWIVGDVGTGKSTFCKMMIQSWCSAANIKNLEAIDKAETTGDGNTNESNLDIIDESALEIKDKIWTSAMETRPGTFLDDLKERYVTYRKEIENCKGEILVSDESAISDKKYTYVKTNDEYASHHKDHKSIIDKNEISASIKNKSNNVKNDNDLINDKDKNAINDAIGRPIIDKDESAVNGKGESGGNSEDELAAGEHSDMSVDQNDDFYSFLKGKMAEYTAIAFDDENDGGSFTSEMSFKSISESYLYNSDGSMESIYEYLYDSDSGEISDSEYQLYDHNKFLAVHNENIKEMRKFEFLFFIPLQRMSGLSDIVEMIKAFVTTADLSSNEFIDEIFEQESERCIIVADGLDEWIPQRSGSVLQHVSYGMPNRARAK